MEIKRVITQRHIKEYTIEHVAYSFSLEMLFFYKSTVCNASILHYRLGGNYMIENLTVSSKLGKHQHPDYCFFLFNFYFLGGFT